MHRFRYISAYVCAALLLCILTGCGSSQAVPQEETQAEAAASPAPPTEATTVPLPPDDSLLVIPGDYLCRYDSTQTGDYLDYYLFIPEEPEENMPLVIFLHGDSQADDPESLADYGMIREAKKIYGSNYPFIAISPCTRVISWVNDPIPQTLMELINNVVDTYAIDREKIIITGHSRGAIGTWNLISLYGDFFSAAVPISCDCGDRIINYTEAAEVPTRAFVGDLGDLDEKYQDPMRYMCYEMNQHGGDAELTVLIDHYHDATCSDAFTEELFIWMLTQ